jgi:hypothetical protein
MSIAITLKEPGRPLGGRNAVAATLALDSSYPTGGEAVTAAMFGLSEIEELIIETPVKAGVLLSFDKANKKVLAYKTQAIVTAEQLTVSSDAGTLANVPASILAIHGTVGSTSTNFRVVAAARTLATGECKVNYATGVVTFYGSDDPTAVTVDYLTRRAAEAESGLDLSAVTGVRVIALGY